MGLVESRSAHAKVLAFDLKSDKMVGLVDFPDGWNQGTNHFLTILLWTIVREVFSEERFDSLQFWNI